MGESNNKTDRTDEYRPSWRNLRSLYLDVKFNKKQYKRLIEVDTKKNTFILGILVSIFLGVFIELANFSFLAIEGIMVAPELNAFIIRTILLLTSFVATFFLFLYNKHCELLQSKIESAKTLYVTNNLINNPKEPVFHESINNICFRTFINYLLKATDKTIETSNDLIDDNIKKEVNNFITRTKVYLVGLWISSIASAILLILNFVAINGWI